MARPAKFTRDEILDAALDAVAAHRGATTIKEVAEQVGAPVGSIYHRFTSREELLGSLWIREIQQFHVGLLSVADLDDPHEALLASARHIPAYCRERPRAAVAMTLFRQKQLAREGPESLREQASHLNDNIDQVLRRILRRRFASVTTHRMLVTQLAIRQTPYGMVRPFVGSDLPHWMDDACVRAADGVLTLLEP